MFKSIGQFRNSVVPWRRTLSKSKLIENPCFGVGVLSEAFVFHPYMNPCHSEHGVWDGHACQVTERRRPLAAASRANPDVVTREAAKSGY